MKRGQIFTRAKVDGIWQNVDVLDLDDESFKLFILDFLHRAGFLVGVKPEKIAEPDIELKLKPQASSSPPATDQP